VEKAISHKTAVIPPPQGMVRKCQRSMNQIGG